MDASSAWSGKCIGLLLLPEQLLLSLVQPSLLRPEPLFVLVNLTLGGLVDSELLVQGSLALLVGQSSSDAGRPSLDLLQRLDGAENLGVTLGPEIAPQESNGHIFYHGQVFYRSSLAAAVCPSHAFQGCR